MHAAASVLQLSTFVISACAMDYPNANILAGWVGMLGGVVSGAVIGLYFHDECWIGGYGSFRRRMVRLGHISFFGLGILNVLAGLMLLNSEPARSYGGFVVGGFVFSLLAMPLCCFLTAWKDFLRYLFPLPIIGVLAGILGLLAGWAGL